MLKLERREGKEIAFRRVLRSVIGYVIVIRKKKRIVNDFIFN